MSGGTVSCAAGETVGGAAPFGFNLIVGEPRIVTPAASITRDDPAATRVMLVVPCSVTLLAVNRMPFAPWRENSPPQDPALSPFTFTEDLPSIPTRSSPITCRL